MNVCWRLLKAFLIIFSLLTCSDNQNESNSFANIKDVKIQKIHLDLEIDFKNKQLLGYAVLYIKHINKVNEIVLDTRDLKVAKVMLNDSIETSFYFADARGDFGSPLHIRLTADTEHIKIFYSTAPNAAALQWLSSQQTLDKKFPFVYSQNQPILARSWLPCQDTPAVRFTYTATIKTDPGLLVLMSAQNPLSKNKSGIYHFKMDQPVPSYLLAIASGNLAFQALGKNSGVYSNPLLIEKAAYELADTEAMMQAASKLYGPYLWERFDILILPASFPYGGMENPKLTFITPTIIAGDRSLVSVIAHELAHSWSGNLVTNENWADLWINEGFTSYFELRIMEEVYDKEYSAMIEQLGYQDLMKTIRKLGHEHADTKLARNPSSPLPFHNATIAYDKGARFLRTLEVSYGRQEFDLFLTNYFRTFAFKNMTSEKFVKYLNEELVQKSIKSTSHTVKIYEWIYGTGMPDKYEIPYSSEFDKVDIQREMFTSGKAAKDLQAGKWTAWHWQHFLKALPNDLTFDQMDDLDKTFNLTTTANFEIAFLWLKLSITNNYQPAYPTLVNFLSNTGRNKFLRPLFQTLCKTSEGKITALELFKNNRKNYHPLTIKSIEKVIGIKG